MPDTDGTGYDPTRFHVYVDGRPFGPVFPTDAEAQALADEQRENFPNCDIAIVALAPDEDPNSVVIPGFPHNSQPSVNLTETDSKLPPYYHVIFGKAVLGFGDGDPWNIFNKANAEAIRDAAIADMTSDDSLPVDEANRLVKVVQVGDG